MHHKPYWKLQKRKCLLKASRDMLRTPVNHQSTDSDEKGKAKYMKPTVFLQPLLVKASCRKPFSKCSVRYEWEEACGEEPECESQKACTCATVHQTEEGLPGSWAIVKPGNTKEKIAAHQCSNRIGSKKIKSSWDTYGRATKRRKTSGDLKKAKVHLERLRETNSQCYQPEPFAYGIEHCSVHYLSDSVYTGQPLTVVQMVAFLEQRASALLASYEKNCTNLLLL
ncbi:F-box only protein 34 [Cricetulus griseus]|uniref:F-box only protein 34 n=1 Tax=Cricetulus griseus TaxID=10029 RepID=G3IBZ6_CRIGR|nr:F-box only protein 34 [Cricetulus griseus]ERE86059.1 F-box only protein 34 [Cricetulus griseus]